MRGTGASARLGRLIAGMITQVAQPDQAPYLGPRLGECDGCRRQGRPGPAGLADARLRRTRHPPAVQQVAQPLEEGREHVTHVFHCALGARRRYTAGGQFLARQIRPVLLLAAPAREVNDDVGDYLDMLWQHLRDLAKYLLLHQGRQL